MAPSLRPILRNRSNRFGPPSTSGSRRAQATPLAPKKRRRSPKPPAPARTCQQLLLVEPALWTFVSVPGVEPTHNTAERSLRPGVIWKRISFGSESQTGSEFVARMLTTVSSLTAQQRDVLDFLTQTYRAARFGQQPPSLLPQPMGDPETLLSP